MKLPERLCNRNFKFIKVASNDKKAFERDWQTGENYFFDDKELNKHLEKNGNYGVLCGYKNLIVVDADTKEAEKIIEERLPETLTIQSNKGKHYYFTINNWGTKHSIDDDKKHIADIQYKGHYVVGPNSIHPKTKKPYTIVKDVDIQKITENDLKYCFHEFIIQVDTDKHITEPITNLIDTKVFKDRGNGILEGPHPIHGSDTGNNMVINTKKNCWYCFRHECGGGPFKLCAVVEKIVKCENLSNWKPNRKEINNINKLLKEKYNFNINIKEPSEFTLIPTNSEYIQYKDNNFFIYHEKGIWHKKQNQKNDDITCVFWGKLDITACLQIDDNDPVYTYKINNSVEYTDDINGIISRLKSIGGVVDTYKLTPAINVKVTTVPKITGKSTIGVYETKNKLDLITEAHGLHQTQRSQYKAIKRIYKERNGYSKIELNAYFKMKEYWPDNEFYPVMGMTLMAPFAYLLKSKYKMFFPHIFHYGRDNTRSGKSKIPIIFSCQLFNISDESGDGINSTYRLGAEMNKICGLALIDEAEKIDWNSLLGMIKKAASSDKVSQRGTVEQKMNKYDAKVVFCFTSNKFPTNFSNADMLRFIKIDFCEKTSNLDIGLKINNETNELKPIGWFLVEEIIDMLNNSLDVLKSEINKYTKLLAKVNTRKLNLEADRWQSWAVIYVGLDLWNKLSIKNGCDWRAPTIEEFYSKVIFEVEKRQQEGILTPIEQLRDAFDRYCSRNTGNDSIVKGDGETFVEDDDFYYISTALYTELQNSYHLKYDGTATDMYKEVSKEQKTEKDVLEYKKMTKTNRTVRCIKLHKNSHFSDKKTKKGNQIEQWLGDGKE